MKVKSDVYEVVNTLTGELMSYDVKVPAVDDKWCIYFASNILNTYKKVHTREEKVLSFILEVMDRDNTFHISNPFKKKIKNKFNVSESALHNICSQLTRKNVIKRLDKGMYAANPYMFGKGSMSHIAKLRLDYEYADEGVKYAITREYLPEEAIDVDSKLSAKEIWNE